MSHLDGPMIVVERRWLPWLSPLGNFRRRLRRFRRGKAPETLSGDPIVDVLVAVLYVPWAILMLPIEVVAWYLFGLFAEGGRRLGLLSYDIEAWGSDGTSLGRWRRRGSGAVNRIRSELEAGADPTRLH